jgi:iron complex outermembrane recepter protein
LKKILLCFVLASARVFAQEPSIAPPVELQPMGSEEEKPIDVTVRGHAKPQSRGAADFDLHIGALKAVPRKNASELLKIAPGILLTNDGGEAHADQVFLRGFDAREGQDIEFTVGGVPINESGNLHGNGYADTHFIIPELVHGVRVVEGPFDPRQGNYAVAGSADYQLSLEKRGMTTRYTYGSFNTQRLLLTWGPNAMSDGTFAGVELYQTDGFGENRDGKRASAMAQYEGHTGDSIYRLSFNAYIANFHSAGVLRQDDYQNGRVGFFDTYDPRQGAMSQRYSFAADLETQTGPWIFYNQAFVIARPMRIRENFTGFLLDPQEPQQTPHRQRGDLIDLQSMALTIGAHGFSRYTTHLWNQLQEVETGYYARGDFVSASQMRLQAASERPYHTDTNLESRLGDLGMYLDVNLHPVRWLAVRGGFRGDLFSYDVLDKCAVKSVAHPSRTNPPGDQSCLSQQDFGAYREPTARSTTTGSALLPRVSLLLGPWKGLTASSSFGRGVRSIDPIYISQDRKTPFAEAQSVDAGVAYHQHLAGVDMNLRSSFFQTRVDHDLIFSETVGRNVLGGSTMRTGNATSARFTGGFYDVAANITYVKAVFQDSGLLIPYIPSLVTRLDATLFGNIPSIEVYDHPIAGLVSTGIGHIAPRPLPLSEQSDPIFTVDCNASLSWRLFELGLSVTNLFNAHYRLNEYNFVSDFHNQNQPTLLPTRHFTAGAPRSLFLTFAVNLGGEG